jgi:hypothetical protein
MMSYDQLVATCSRTADSLRGDAPFTHHVGDREWETRCIVCRVGDRSTSAVDPEEAMKVCFDCGTPLGRFRNGDRLLGIELWTLAFRLECTRWVEKSGFRCYGTEKAIGGPGGPPIKSTRLLPRRCRNPQGTSRKGCIVRYSFDPDRDDPKDDVIWYAPDRDPCGCLPSLQGRLYAISGDAVVIPLGDTQMIARWMELDVA